MGGNASNYDVAVYFSNSKDSNVVVELDCHQHIKHHVSSQNIPRSTPEADVHLLLAVLIIDGYLDMKLLALFYIWADNQPQWNARSYNACLLSNTHHRREVI